MFFKKVKQKNADEDAAGELRVAMRQTLWDLDKPVQLDDFDDLVQLAAMVCALKWQAQKMYLLKVQPEIGEKFAKRPGTGAWNSVILTLCDATLDPTFRRRIRDRFPRFDIEHEVDCILGSSKDKEHAKLFSNQVCFLASLFALAIHRGESPLARYFEQSSSWVLQNTLVLWARLGMSFDPDSCSALIPQNFVYALAGDEPSFIDEVWSQLDKSAKIVISC